MIDAPAAGGASAPHPGPKAWAVNQPGRKPKS